MLHWSFMVSWAFMVIALSVLFLRDDDEVVASAIGNESVLFRYMNGNSLIRIVNEGAVAWYGCVAAADDAASLGPRNRVSHFVVASVAGEKLIALLFGWECDDLSLIRYAGWGIIGVEVFVVVLGSVHGELSSQEYIFSIARPYVLVKKWGSNPHSR